MVGAVVMEGPEEAVKAVRQGCSVKLQAQRPRFSRPSRQPRFMQVMVAEVVVEVVVVVVVSACRIVDARRALASAQMCGMGLCLALPLPWPNLADRNLPWHGMKTYAAFAHWQSMHGGSMAAQITG